MASSIQRLAIALSASVVYVSAVVPNTQSKIEATSAKSGGGLRGAVVVNATDVQQPHLFAAVNSTHTAPACQCVTANPAWKACTRTVPRCVFIDLGAADGNSFDTFLKNGYGPVGNCPSSQWSSVLVEANPRFDQKLKGVGSQHPQQLTVMSSTAAYMCEGSTSFFLDTVNTGVNYWGSSMSANHPDVQKKWEAEGDGAHDEPKQDTFRADDPRRLGHG
jgi:hypothetical protein